MSPRVLRIGDLWGEWRSPCNSILQGCSSSNSWAMALLYRLLQDLHSRFPVQIGQQVDDINHHSQGTFFQALHWSVEATCMLDRGTDLAVGLTLSQDKSVIVASHPQLLRAVQRELLEQGLSFEGAASVRDVGLDGNAGHGRSVKFQNKREQKCRKRNAHIKVIQSGLKLKHQTMKLFKTGILPAVAYGHAGMACARVLSSTKGRWLRTRVARGSRLRALRQFYTSILERTGTQRSGFRWTSFGLGSSSKARKWGTDRKELMSPARGPPLLLV